MTDASSSCRGFSIVEMLVALLILASGLLALARFQTVLISSDSLAKQRSEATLLAEQKVDILRSYGTMSAYSSMTSGSDSVGGSNASYSRSWTVTPSASPAYVAISITVSWMDRNNTAQSVTLKSSIASNNPRNTAYPILYETTST